jgi:hypothetical protein
MFFPKDLAVLISAGIVPVRKDSIALRVQRGRNELKSAP